jgi:arginine exporter protein ArgO
MDQFAPSALAAIDPEMLLFVTVGAFVFVVWFAISSWRKVAETQAREQTKREIAAYVAAPKLMGTQSPETEKAIADAVAWGTIKPEKAEGLFRALRSGPNAEPASPKA